MLRMLFTFFAIACLFASVAAGFAATSAVADGVTGDSDQDTRAVVKSYVWAVGVELFLSAEPAEVQKKWTPVFECFSKWKPAYTFLSSGPPFNGCCI